MVFQDVADFNVDPTIAWHDSVADREARNPAFKIGARTIICSFRKLPSWLESRYNFEFQRNPHLIHRPELLLEGKFLEASGFENHADRYIKKYLPESVLQSGKVRFLRTEYFESDFKSIFSNYLDISRIPYWEYQRNVNSSKSHLPINIREAIHDDSGKIYEKCPCWRVAEEMAYEV